MSNIRIVFDLDNEQAGMIAAALSFAMERMDQETEKNPANREAYDRLRRQYHALSGLISEIRFAALNVK